ncbi:MAG: hypothetical protein KA059_03405 [Elusimicrobiales bacterium]|jgi:hypothetical protein|nr:hypothetical protein [Elusimicrobiales bacterium]NLH39157.1 hypothetical protein [Elusimicrobiota bacterium]
MNYYIKKFSEFKTTQNTDEIKWDDCVVWKESDCFVYLESSEIRYVSWSLGVVSIIPHPESILAKYFNAILINSPTVLVGKNIKTGN